MGKESKSVGIVRVEHLTFARPPEKKFVLDSGRRLGPITVAYETYGKLNADHSNAILVCHALTGDAHAAGKHSPKDRKSGWWDDMIGPGKAFDTRDYFVICSNILGGCQGTTGPLTIDQETGKKYGLHFPVVTIGDMVRVQKRLIDHLGIKKLCCITGGSMGGMQVLEWVARYPEMVGSAIIIASTSRLSSQAIAFDTVGRNAILSDPDWCEGHYTEKRKVPARGLAIARMIGHITYLSKESMKEKFGRKLQDRNAFGYDFSDKFAVESYLHYQGQAFVERFDANSYLYVTKAMDYYNLAEQYGSLEKAFAGYLGRSLLISFTSDWLFPPAQSQEIVNALVRLGRDVSYCNIDSSYGHDAFLLEFKQITRLVKNFLNNISCGRT
jgi:homoserine O-acetyltransferase/O-succinyltransferase